HARRQAGAPHRAFRLSARGDAVAGSRPSGGHLVNAPRASAAPAEGEPAAANRRLEHLRPLVGAVPDPGIPVLTLADLGSLRDVREEAGRLVVELTPTFSGCPATAVIAADVRAVLAAAGEPGADVRIVLSPAWTTDWIGPQAREKLRRYVIAPPGQASASCGSGLPFPPPPVAHRCPGCRPAPTA